MAEFTLAGLRVVQQVAAMGSFTRAAETLGYTQSAVSRQVAAMEAAAGGPLFDRRPRGVELTPAGQVLVRRATAVLADLAATEGELAGLRDRLAGRLAIGAYPTAAMALVPRAMAQLVSGHPGLAVVLEEAATPALLRRLRAGRLDVAVIGVGHGLPDYDLSGLRQAAALQGDLLVAVPEGHRFTGQDHVTVAELAHEHWIAGDGAAGDPQFGAWPTLPDPHIAHTARGWSTRLGLVAAGLGLTVIPDLALPVLPTGVRAVAVADSHWPGRATVVVTGPRPSARAQAMVTALRDRSASLDDA
ncbi:LysR family transcriptional regulator [Streptomyces albus]|uniref:LysR family transcriptional regulator n=1 Tax=Streptomyces albus (strain ATCC 21838 / DSM 41398 / FERM P-419 / JCM 4703 / NBRC 107858) TaxID=1081613 RepID=A0A0B5F866_STRA4|nr:LysR family transcriptional regulator [Streptomyces albus]AOU80972.1 LysR family transcriptional regulator [Streptomyces albus]AYN36674.1 LysR family transcriptional regulator [Streptomyces albus]